MSTQQTVAINTSQKFAIWLIFLSFVVLIISLVLAFTPEPDQELQFAPPAAGVVINEPNGRYETELYSPEARKQAADEITRLKLQYDNAKTEKERRRIALSIHQRVSLIPYGTLPDDLQQFVSTLF